MGCSIFAVIASLIGHLIFLIQHAVHNNIFISLIIFTVASIVLMVLLYQTAPLRIRNAVAKFGKDIELVNDGQLSQLNDKHYPPTLKPQIKMVNGHFQLEQDRIRQEETFSSEASHELRTPLAGIRLQAQIAQRTQDPEQRDKALSNIIKSIDKSSKTLQLLLTLSRLTKRRVIDGMTSNSLQTLLANALSDLSPLTRAKGITVDINIVNTSTPKLVCHKEHVELLIKEAVDYIVESSPLANKIITTIGSDASDVTIAFSVVYDVNADDKMMSNTVFPNAIKQSRLSNEVCQRICNLHGGIFMLGEEDETSALTIKLPVTQQIP